MHEAVELLEGHLAEVHAALKWQVKTIDTSATNELITGYDLLSKKYSFSLAHKLAFTRKQATTYLKNGNWQKWARVTMPYIPDVGEWQHGDCTFASFSLPGPHDEDTHSMILTAWAKSIFNDFLISLVCDACSEKDRWGNALSTCSCILVF
jgi:hypothetical protein